MKGYEIGDSIHGHRIIAEARKVSDPVVIVKSARHKAQRIVLTENAFAIIDRKGLVQPEPRLVLLVIPTIVLFSPLSTHISDYTRAVASSLFGGVYDYFIIL